MSDAGNSSSKSVEVASFEDLMWPTIQALRAMGGCAGSAQQIAEPLPRAPEVIWRPPLDPGRQVGWVLDLEQQQGQRLLRDLRHGRPEPAKASDFRCHLVAFWLKPGAMRFSDKYPLLLAAIIILLGGAAVKAQSMDTIPPSVTASPAYYKYAQSQVVKIDPAEAASLASARWELWMFRKSSTPSHNPAAPEHWGTLLDTSAAEAAKHWQIAVDFSQKYNRWCGCDGYGELIESNAFGPVAVMPDSEEQSRRRQVLEMNSEKLGFESLMSPLWLHLFKYRETFYDWGASPILDNTAPRDADAQHLRSVFLTLANLIHAFDINLTALQSDIYNSNVTGTQARANYQTVVQANNRLQNYFDELSSQLNRTASTVSPPVPPPVHKAKYGPMATPLSLSHEYMRESPAADYWALSPYYTAQQTDSACSLATITMIVNAARAGMALTAADELVTQDGLLERVQNQKWARAVAPNGVGVSLDELSSLLEASLRAYGINKFEIETVHVSDTAPATGDKLHRILLASEASAGNFVIAHFIQSAYTGDADVGHIAPVAAYDAKRGRVLIMDPDRQRYEPYWVNEDQFLKGMASQDQGHSRGYLWLRIGANP